MRAYQQEAGLSNINIVVELHRAGARTVEVDHFVRVLLDFALL